MTGPVDKFTQALAHLLPQGAAWPRDPASVWMRLLAGIAATFDELHRYTHQAVGEWLPHSTRTRLAEWEEATGLPDGCFGATQTDADRRARLLARLRGYQGAYADSSPAALAPLVAFCAALGYTLTARYNLPFRVGMRCGQRLGANDGRLYLFVPVARTADAAALVCSLDRVVPARFSINVVFV